MSDETAGLHQAGSNISTLKAAISIAVGQIQQQKKTRTACNEQISAIRADLEAQGVKKKAFDMALKVAEMDPDDRDGFDIAYDICREAMGTPYSAQGDLFTDTKEGRQAVQSEPSGEGDDENRVVPIGGEGDPESNPVDFNKMSDGEPDQAA